MKNKKIILLVVASMMIFSLTGCGSTKENVNVSDVTTETEASDTVLAGPGIAVVETDAGSIQGYIRNDIYTYHGIPYAEANARFVPAEKTAHWDGVRLAFDYGVISPQQQMAGGSDSSWENPSRQFAMDNNCQNLNIWTPAIQDNEKDQLWYGCMVVDFQQVHLQNDLLMMVQISAEREML